MARRNSKFKIQNSKLDKHKGSSEMARLLASYKAPFVSLEKGQLIEGTITKLSPSEILIDIAAKTEAVVLEKDKKILRNILSTLKLGEKVTVSVLNPESDFGNPVVSLRRFVGNNLWDLALDKQKNQDQLDGTIKEVTRGGFLVDTSIGLSGFLPNSHSTFGKGADEDSPLRQGFEGQAQSLQNLVGQVVPVYVLDLNREAKKVIFSQKKVLTSEGFDKIIKGFKIGQKISSTISHISTFGVFVNLPVSLSASQGGPITGSEESIDGLIHISEVSWTHSARSASSGQAGSGQEAKLEELFKVGQTIEAVVIGFDKNGKRIDLSIKKLTDDPFTEVAKQFSADQTVTGTVKELNSQGVTVELPTSTGVLEGMIRSDKIPPGMVFEVGKPVEATVLQVDTRRRRILLVPILKTKFVGYR